MEDPSKSFHSSHDENSQPLPLEPQQEANNSLTSSTAQPFEENSKKRRGRPAGSKNKSKPPVIINQGIKSTINTVRIEIPHGYDIVEMIEKFARHHRVGVNIQSGTGYICNFAFHNTCFMSSGVFGLMNITGTFMDNSIIDTPSSSSNGGALSSLPYNGPWLMVVCKGAEEKVFGGIVAEKLMVYSSVAVVYVTTFKSCGIKALDPAECASKGEQPAQHGGGYFGGSSSSSTHSGGGGLAGVGDSTGRLLGGGGNRGVLGGRIKQRNWGFPTQQQPVQHGGGYFGGSSSLNTHPRGGGLGKVGGCADGVPGGGENCGAFGGGVRLGVPAEQQIGMF